jgi:hypothetical protein
MIQCKQCNKLFQSHREFDMHECPSTPDPRHGESWEDYKQRCSEQWVDPQHDAACIDSDRVAKFVADNKMTNSEIKAWMNAGCPGLNEAKPETNNNN